MNRIAILSLVVLSPLSSGCSFSVTGVPGSGVSKSESRELQEFDQISLAGSGTLVVHCGEETFLEVTADDNLLELIETTVEDGTLKIRFLENVRPKIDPEFEIGMEGLKGVSISGSGSATIDQIEAEHLELSISGSGEYLASGTADDVSVKISGAGQADLRKLQALTAKIDITGSGEVVVNAEKDLFAMITGSGDIRYMKEPKIRKTIAGSGSVTPVSDESANDEEINLESGEKSSESESDSKSSDEEEESD